MIDMRKSSLFLSLALLTLASCGEKEEYSDTFTFTADDAAKVSELLDRIEENQVVLTDDGSQGSSSSLMEEIAIDASDAHQFDRLRSELGSLSENTYRVTNAFLNVRSAASAQSELVTELKKGEYVKVLSFPTPQWAEILLPDGRKGFVSSQYVSRVVSEDQMEEIKKQHEGQYEVNFAFLNVRSEPSPQGLKLGELQSHQIVKPLSISGEWAKIAFEGKDGYVSTTYLRQYVPKLIVRQERFSTPIIRYHGDEEGIAATIVKHIALMKELGKTIITLRDFSDLLRAQEENAVRIPNDRVILLISDVKKETLKDIADSLRASNVRATFFLESASISANDIPPALIAMLVQNGNDVASMSHNGEDLRALTNQQVLRELAQSRQVLEDLTGKEVLSIAYPRGGVNDRIMEQAIQAGYLFGITLTSSVGEGFERSQFLRLPSNIVTSMTSEQTLKSLVDAK